MNTDHFGTSDLRAAWRAYLVEEQTAAANSATAARHVTPPAQPDDIYPVSNATKHSFDELAKARGR